MLSVSHFITAPAQGLTFSKWFTCPSGTQFWKFTCPAKIFTCPTDICTGPVKLTYTAEKRSTCPYWKITCPVRHVTTKVYLPWDKIYMPRACGHALMSSPASLCLNTGSPFISVLWVNVNHTQLLISVSIHSFTWFKPCLPRPSWLYSAGNQNICDIWHD